MFKVFKIVELKIKHTTAPLKAGIYFFYNVDGEIVYIGKAKNLRGRLSNYLLDYYYFYSLLEENKGKSSAYFSSRMFRLVVKRIGEIDKVSFDCSRGNSSSFEKELIKKHSPKYNSVFVDNLSNHLNELDLIDEELKEYFGYNSEAELTKVMGIL